MTEIPIFLGNPGPHPNPLPFDEIVTHHSNVRDAVATCASIYPSNAYSHVAYGSFIYIFNAYKAIGLLLPELYHEASSVLFRQLWEVSMNLHWIALDPENRATSFCNYTIIEYEKQVVRSGCSRDIERYRNITESLQAEFHFKDRKGRRKRHPNFSKYTVGRRAEELGDPWKIEYEDLYSLGSAHAHGAPGAIFQGIFVQNYTQSEVRERNSTAAVAIWSIHTLVRVVDLLEQFGVIVDCNEVQQRYKVFLATLGDETAR